MKCLILHVANKTDATRRFHSVCLLRATTTGLWLAERFLSGSYQYCIEKNKTCLVRTRPRCLSFPKQQGKNRDIDLSGLTVHPKPLILRFSSKVSDSGQMAPGTVCDIRTRPRPSPGSAAAPLTGRVLPTHSPLRVRVRGFPRLTEGSVGEAADTDTACLLSELRRSFTHRASRAASLCKPTRESST